MKKIEIIQFNCNGARAQFIQIGILIKRYAPSFILLQELRMTKKEKFNMKGYVFLRKHPFPESSSQPSVGMLIKQGIQYDLIDTPADQLIIGINTICRVPIALFTYYDNHRTNKLCEKQLSSICELSHNKTVLMGDFNARHPLWDQGKKKNYIRNSRAETIIDFIGKSDMIILNDGSPTRISPIFNQENSSIDLTIVDHTLSHLFDWSVASEDYGSDHLPTFLSMTSQYNSTIQEPFWDFKHTDWDTFNENCSLKIALQNPTDNIDIIDQKITEQILNGLIKSTPLIKTDKMSKRKPPWWDKDLEELKKEKTKKLKKYVKSQTKENLTALKKVNAKYKLMIRQRKTESWEKYIDDMNGEIESKDLWKRINSLNSKQTSKKIINLVEEDGSIIVNPQDISNKIGLFYKDVSSSDNIPLQRLREVMDLDNRLKTPPVNLFIEMDSLITLQELEYVIKNTHDSSPGIDKIKYCVYKNLHYYNMIYLLEFYNKVWESGKRPVSWNLSKVVPIPKRVGANTPGDTRPINLINTRTKLFDKILNNRLSYILEENQLIDDNQFGFRKNRQTLSSLINLNKKISDAFDNRGHIQMISFDIKKAFDRIWPQTVSEALHRFKIGGKVYQHVQSFLENRKFFVQVGGETSQQFISDFGVPQGSPISATLFLIAFQGILDTLKTIDGIQYSAYADDLIIYSDHTNNEINRIRLQSAIDLITEKGYSSGIQFSYEKTTAIHFCRKLKCVRTSNTLESQIIEECNTLKYLGLFLNKRLNFSQHVNALKTKLVKDLQIIKILSHSRYGLNQELLKKIIMTLTISKVKYGIEIYGNTSKANLKTINTALNNIKRKLTMVFISTPILSLDILSGIPNIHQIIVATNLSTAVRMMANSKIEYDQMDSKLKHFKDLFEYRNHTEGGNGTNIEVVKNQTNVSPLISIKNRIYNNIYGLKKDDMSNNEIRAKTYEFLNSQQFEYIVYTDGSKTSNSTTYAVTTSNNVIFQKKLNPKSSIYTAEASAVLKAVEYLNEVSNNIEKSLIVTDSLSVVEALMNKTKKENETIKKIFVTIKDNIYILWCPSHKGIQGNEFVDVAANEAHELEIGCDMELPWQDIQSHMKSYHYKIKQTQWETNVDNKLFKIHPRISCNAPYTINRKQQMIINRLRAGHTWITHQHKISKEPTPLCQYCQLDLTVEHFFNCQDSSVIALRRKYKIGEIQEMLFRYDRRSLMNTLKYIEELGYLHVI